MVPDFREIIPLTISYSETSKIINSTIKRRFTLTQQTQQQLQNYKTISSYRKNKNLGDLLVRSRFSSGPSAPAPPWAAYFQKYGLLPDTGKDTPNKQKISLETTNLVYVITCTHCNKKYVGETKHTLKTKLKQHLYNIQNSRNNTRLASHF